LYKLDGTPLSYMLFPFTFTVLFSVDLFALAKRETAPPIGP